MNGQPGIGFKIGRIAVEQMGLIGTNQKDIISLKPMYLLSNQ